MEYAKIKPNNMKKLYSLILIAVLSISSFGAYAQENGNRDANGNVVRGPYLTNRFCDNWFIGAGVGATMYIGGYNRDFGGRILPTYDVNFGKWFTPSVGARIDFNITPLNREKIQGAWHKFTYWDVHADFLWNLSNSLGGYKETRVYQAIPFIGAGLAHNSGGTMRGATFSFALSAGLINKFRVSNRIDLNLEFIATGTRQTFDQVAQSKHHTIDVPISVVAGITFKLGKTNFQRYTAPTAMTVSNASLEKEYEQFKNDLAESQKANKDLQAQMAALSGQLAGLSGTKTITKEKQTTFLTLYFNIGESTLTEKDLATLEVYMDGVEKLSKDGEKRFHIIGAADKATGNADINYRLSKERAEYVKNILINKYGVKAGNITTTFAGDKDNRFDTPYLNRSATIFVTVE